MSPVERIRSFAVPALLAGYVLVPGPGSLFDGLPLTPAALWVLGVMLPLAFLFAGQVPLSGRRVGGSIVLVPGLAAGLAIGLATAKLCLSPLALAPGLVPTYFASAPPAGPAEQPPAARPDARLDFHQHDFALHFFNDSLRFNFYRPGEPRRTLLPFSVRWDGWLHVERPGRHVFFVRSHGPASLTVDGNTTLRKRATFGEERVSTELMLTAGMHRVSLAYESPYGTPRRLVAGLLSSAFGASPPARSKEAAVAAPSDDIEVPFSPTSAVSPWPSPYSDGRLRRAAVARAALLGLDGSYLLLLLPIFWSRVPPLGALTAPRRSRPLPPLPWRRAALVVLGCAALALGQLVFANLRGRCLLLSGGDDWLTYETYARDILHHGPLMLLGAPRGQAAPFLYQPLYPYVLALCHGLLGEDLGGVLGAQAAVPVLCGILLYLTGERLWGARAGLLTLVLWFASLPFTIEYVSLSWRLLSENLAFVLFPLSVLLWIQLLQRPTPARAVWAGAGHGLTVVARSVTLPAFPLLLGLSWIALRRRGIAAGRRRAVLTLATAAFLLIGALPALRNRIATGTATLLPTSGSYDLLLRNAPPRDLGLDREALPGDQAARGGSSLCRRLSLSLSTCTVMSYAEQEPRVFFTKLWDKGLFCLGWRRVSWLSAPYQPMTPVLALPWLGVALYLGSWAARRRDHTTGGGKEPPSPHFVAEAAVLLVFAAVQLSIMPLFAPTLQYGNRLVLPMYLALFPFGGYALSVLLDAARRIAGIHGTHARGSQSKPTSSTPPPDLSAYIRR